MLIPSRYFDGVDTLTYGYPWITPEAICWLEKNLNKSMHVIEFGCGGSTIFLARLCATVYSIDNNIEWIVKTDLALHAAGLSNADLYTAKALPDALASFNRTYDVAFVDCCDMDRYQIVKHMVSRSKIIVVDNYDAEYVGNTDALFDATWQILTYDDLHWVGKGTKIYFKK